MEEKKINVIKINVYTVEAERKLEKLIELTKTAQESVRLNADKEKSIKEILRQQLNILAERSKIA